MPPSSLKFQIQQNRMNAASMLATEILTAANLLVAPVDPLVLAATESRWMSVKSGNFKDAFDGLLEYHMKHDRFLLLYNNKYDSDPNQHHPRTRFSIAHELGHFYLDHHRAYLMNGGGSHRSRGEFLSADEVIIEREADAFAAGLLMPTPLLRHHVNQGELSLERIKQIANHFQTSLMSTAIRCVQLSDFPCEVLGICSGRIAWRFRPLGNDDPLTKGKCYRSPNGPLRSKKAQEVWRDFENGSATQHENAGAPQDWFQIYSSLDNSITVWEQYLPLYIMDTLVVLLTITESDLFE